ncbi:complex I intermediate-associated protein 30-domain-containing protein [Microdochium trichocladiopsis]|uniref:Complex I intermediate-associated protein 30-domain-containing protein n=1 Tax=Microdochium trichocladiopsis TaxID=1682393 RepID=A0A9P8YGC4_9PEZI|nr:complex I intermediate-associated protein 30-domain-containing protein [Microdochium trichocladiopsis]KAH7037479.1 complex I intermediate-associated protein 30-domain-containing protein [Microdochium trichocladiopsis]
MHATAVCLRRGFWGRSIEEFKRLSNIVFQSEGIKGPSGPMPLQSFSSPDSLQDVKVMYDIDIDGFSHAQLDYVPPVTTTPHPASSAPRSPSSHPSTSKILAAVPGHMRFHGNISTRLPENRPEVTRSGYAAWRTLDRPPTIFGRSLWNIDSYSYLGLRIKSDGRSYLVNIQTESVVPEDLHQHRLFARRPGEWETVHIKWNDFVRTNHGYVVEPQTEMLRQKVKSIGIGLTDRIEGPFDLSIQGMWATNTPEAEMDADVHPVPETAQPKLRNKQGKTISWS